MSGRRRVSGVPEHRRFRGSARGPARRAWHGNVGRAAGHDRRHRQPFVEQCAAQRRHRGECLIGLRTSARQDRDRAGGRRRRAGRQERRRAALPGADTAAAPRRRAMPVRCMPTSRSTSRPSADSAPAPLPPTRAPPPLSSSTIAETLTPGNVRASSTSRRTFGPTGWYASSTSVTPAARDHLGFGDRGALEPADAARDMRVRAIGASLCVFMCGRSRRRRPRSRSCRRRFSSARSGYTTQRGRGNLGDVCDRPPVVSATSVNLEDPFDFDGDVVRQRHQADRAPRADAAIGPQISANSSEQPLMTVG